MENMHRFLLHNGEILPTDAHTASVGQTGLLNGWGVFSTLRVWDGVMFAYERHWARMSRDAALMRVPMPGAEELRAMLGRLIGANEAWNATLRVAIVRNLGGLFQAPHLTRAFDVVAFTVPLQDWGLSARLAVEPNARFAASPYSGAKILSWAQNLTILERAKERGFDEAVLLNEHGLVSECTSANLFAAFGGKVYTPPLASGCLAGITREYLLEVVRVPGYEVREKDLTLEELYEADGVFLSSSTRECLAVREIEGRRVSGNGDAAAALGRGLREAMAGYAGAFRKSNSVLR